MFRKPEDKDFILIDPEFVQIFPIFRGILLIFLYSVLFGWNIKVWKQSRINYKLILHYRNYECNMKLMLKRAAFNV